VVALVPGGAGAGKAGDEYDRIVSDRAADFRAPVLARPQVGRIPPHWYPGGFELLLQLVDPM